MVDFEARDELVCRTQSRCGARVRRPVSLSE
jgi:hypothetical protein